MSKSSDISLEIDKDIQYVIEKKHTISSVNLQTQKFENNKWCPCTNKDNVNKQEISIIEYNVFGALKYDKKPYDVDSRFELLKNEIDKKADFIILHEVSKKILLKLMDLDWIRKDYYLSEFNTERVNILYGIGTIILSKIPFQEFRSYVLPGYDMYSLSLGIFLINNNRYVLCGAQYHSSKEFYQFRKAQFHATLEILEQLKDNDKIMNFIWASDFNFDLNKSSTWEEGKYMNQLLERYKLNFVWKDAWCEGKKNASDDGFTEDTQVNEMRKFMKSNSRRLDEIPFNISNIEPEEIKQVRFDAILYNGQNLEIDNIKIIGTIENNINGVNIWPSDHFGLFATFTLPVSNISPSTSYVIRYSSLN